MQFPYLDTENQAGYDDCGFSGPCEEFNDVVVSPIFTIPKQLIAVFNRFPTHLVVNEYREERGYSHSSDITVGEFDRVHGDGP